MNNVELKPCPFCGGEAKVTMTHDNIGWMYGVACRDVGCVLGEIWRGPDTFASERLAKKYWNTRKGESNE